MTVYKAVVTNNFMGMEFKVRDGLCLTEAEIIKVHRFYMHECTKEYLKENYSFSSEEELEEKIRAIYKCIDKCDCTEHEAIAEVMGGVSYDETKTVLS